LKNEKLIDSVDGLFVLCHAWQRHDCVQVGTIMNGVKESSNNGVKHRPRYAWQRKLRRHLPQEFKRRRGSPIGREKAGFLSATCALSALAGR